MFGYQYQYNRKYIKYLSFKWDNFGNIRFDKRFGSDFWYETYIQSTYWAGIAIKIKAMKTDYRKDQQIVC